MALIKQLKELEETIYPITKGEAVSLNNNSNVQIEMDKTIRAKDPVDVEPVEAIVSTDMIQDGAITTEKILDGSVNTDKLANASVSTAKLEDGSVTNAKIADAAVKSNNIDFTTFGNDFIKVITTDTETTTIESLESHIFSIYDYVTKPSGYELMTYYCRVSGTGSTHNAEVKNMAPNSDFTQYSIGIANNGTTKSTWRFRVTAVFYKVS